MRRPAFNEAYWVHQARRHADGRNRGEVSIMVDDYLTLDEALVCAAGLLVLKVVRVAALGKR